MSTEILSIPEISSSQQAKEITHNDGLRRVEGLLVRVLSRTTTTPPGSPAAGDTYIIPSGATGIWTGLTNQVAHFYGGAWHYYVPIEGYASWVNDEDLRVTYDGTAWITGSGTGSVTSVGLSMPTEFTVTGSPVTTTGTLTATKANQNANLVYAGPSSGGAAAPAFRALVQADLPAQPYDAGGFFPGAPTASQLILLHVFSRSVTFPSGLTGSNGKAKTAATAQTDIDIKKNGSSVGTIRFAASGTVPTFIMASQTTFAAGDYMEWIAPATPDATLADISVTLAGTR